MKFLYIDVVPTISSIRIAEKTIFYDEIPKLNHKVDFLLRTNIETNRYFTFARNVFSRFSINIPLFFSLKKILVNHEYNIIFSRNYTSISLVPLILCKINKKKFGYIKAFPLTEYFKLEISINKNNFYKIIYFIKYINNYIIEKIILINSDFIITRSDSFKDYLSKKYLLNQNKILSIPMGFDTSVLDQLEKFNYSEHDSFFKYSLIYFGSIERIRNIKFILETIKIVKARVPQIFLKIIGGSTNEVDNLKKEVEKFGLEKNITVLENMNRLNLFKHVINTRYSISPIPPLSIYSISSPTKVMESLGLGVPVIANEEIFEQKTIINESGGGILTKYVPKEFASAIISMVKSDLDFSQSMGLKGKYYIYKQRSYSILAKKLDLFLRENYSRL